MTHIGQVVRTGIRMTSKSRKIISIEVGLDLTKISEVRYPARKEKVYRSIYVQTPDDVFEDGYVRNKEIFCTFLKEVLEREKFKSKYVMFTVASSKIYSKDLSVDNVREGEQMDNYVEEKAPEKFPMDITDYYVTYSVVSRDKKNKKTELMMYAYPSNLLKNYISVAETLKLGMVALNYSASVAGKYVQQNVCDKGKGVAIYIGEHSSTISFIDDNKLKMLRTVNYGTSLFVEAMRELPECQQLTSREAYTILRKNGVLYHTLYGENREKGMEKITMAAASLINSITRVFEFYTSSNKVEDVGRVVIMGDGIAIKGLVRLLENELGMKLELPAGYVEESEKTEKLKNIITRRKTEELSEEEKFERRIYRSIKTISICTGTDTLNLMPYSLRKKPDDVVHYPLFVTAFLVVFIGGFAVRSYVKDYYLEQKAELERLKEQAVKMQYIYELESEKNTYIDAADKLVELDAETYSSGENLRELIEELEASLPTGTLIHSLNISGNTMNMSVSVVSKSMAGQFIKQLGSVSYIESVTVSGISDVTSATTEEVTFSVSCILTKGRKGAEFEVK